MREKKQGSKFDLTEGNILSKLLVVSLPIMGTQVVQMTYNLTDMFWLGRVGANAVAASGTVGMFIWLSNAFMVFGKTGGEIGVAQNLGRNDKELAKTFAQSSVVLSVILGLLFGAVLMFGTDILIGFFNIQEMDVVAQAKSYLFIVSIGIPFTFVSSAVTGVFNGSGNSGTPFLINAVGLVINMILDPVLIFTFDMGIEGAAIATIIAQIAAGILSVLALLYYKNRPFETVRIIALPSKKAMNQIVVWALPIAVESFLFTTLSMIISRFVAGWGANAMATQKVGSQIESLSWLIAIGFSSALTSFIGQNYGAGKWKRIHKGIYISQSIMGIWGVIITIILYFGGGAIFSLFLPGDLEVIKMGSDYLKILAVCQFVACLEGVASGAFRGLGKTIQPSIVSTCSNALRVVAAYFLSRTSLGIDGIWWAVSLGAALRGAWLFIWFLKKKKEFPVEDA